MTALTDPNHLLTEPESVHIGPKPYLSIDLENNKVGDEGAKAIAASLPNRFDWKVYRICRHTIDYIIMVYVFNKLFLCGINSFNRVL